VGVLVIKIRATVVSQTLLEAMVVSPYVNGERTATPLKEHNYLPEFIGDKYKHDRLKPIDYMSWVRTSERTIPSR
jgi:hypothetical protein